MSTTPVRYVSFVPGLSTPPGYSYAAAADGELVFFAGQVPLDADGEVVGADDFEAQVRKTFANLALALAAAGCKTASVLHVRYYVVGLTPGRLMIIRAVRDEHFSGEKPASTLVGVAALFHPDVLIEIEVVARSVDPAAAAPA